MEKSPALILDSRTPTQLKVMDMKASKIQLSPAVKIGRKTVTFATMAALLASTFALGAWGQKASVARGSSLSEEQRILHALNRLGYGARPGDVERVRKMGLENYIKQQLNPRPIDDSVAEAKVEFADAEYDHR